jgi:uncharacterized membrane protein
MGVRVVPLILLVAFGGLLGAVGLLGWRGKLARTGRLGVRTPAALRDDAAFALANRVAGPVVLVAGLAAVLGGIAAFLLGGPLGMVLAAVIGLAGALLFARAGALLGTRAAAALPAPVPDSCATCACGGCALVGKK